jgi:hypothetical protein
MRPLPRVHAYTNAALLADADLGIMPAPAVRVGRFWLQPLLVWWRWPVHPKRQPW